MKITLFTTSQSRHNYLINLLSNSCKELFVVQENRTVSGNVPDHYTPSKIMQKYFGNVADAEKKIFGKSHTNFKNKNVHILPLQSGDLCKHSVDSLSKFLRSDLYVVFGSSFIKGDLVNFLIKNKAINIHIGVSPYYRGTDCNFWALYDENPHLVGSTIHMLSRGLDSGDILYHALSQIKNNPYEYTMSTVKSAFHSLVEKIENETIFDIKRTTQNRKTELRYSKKIHFTEEVVKNFLNKKINLGVKKFDKNLFLDPYILKSL